MVKSKMYLKIVQDTGKSHYLPTIAGNNQVPYHKFNASDGLITSPKLAQWHPTALYKPLAIMSSMVSFMAQNTLPTLLHAGPRIICPTKKKRSNLCLFCFCSSCALKHSGA